MTPPASRKAILGWALYDWANSAFATTVMAGFFPIFFKEYWSRGADVNTSTALLGFGNSLAGLAVALVAPALGAIADRGAAKKRFLTGFAGLGVAMTAALALVGQGAWTWAIGVYALAIIGFAGANVFYDALLPSVAPEDRVDAVSALGYALGYLGGGLLFLGNVVLTLWPRAFGLADAGQAVRVSFLTTAVWWGGFTLFLLRWVPEHRAAGRARGAVAAGFRQLAATFRRIRHLRMVFLFLLAYWFYIDGVDTVILMAVDYGMSLGFKPTDLIVALLLVQFVGFPAALGFGALAGRWGARRCIYLAIGVYCAIALGGIAMTTKYQFYALAIAVGLVQGGIQSLSRSYYARLIPAGQAGEYYGFYNMLGKFAAIVGPALMGGVALVTRHALMPPHPSPADLAAVGHLATRCSLGSVALLFVVGAVLLHFVDDARGRAEAEELSLPPPPQ